MIWDCPSLNKRDVNVKKKKERLNDVLWIEEEEWKSCIVAAEPVDVFDACQLEL